MMGECRLLSVMNEGLVRIATSDFSGDYGAQLWAKAKLRKEKKCFACEGQVAVGTEVYSPITNGYNRMHRICVGCVERMKSQA